MSNEQIRRTSRWVGRSSESTQLGGQAADRGVDSQTRSEPSLRSDITINPRT